MSPNSLYKKILLALFCIYFFTAIVIPSNIKILNKASVSDFILLLIILYYLSTVIFSKTLGLRYILNRIYNFIFSPIILSMSFLLVFMLISVLYSANKAIALNESLRFFLFIVTGFILISELNSTLYFNSFLNTFMASTFIVNIIGLYQFITKKGMSVTLVNLTGAGYTGRVQSVFGNPNAFGAYLVVVLFPFILLFLSSKDIKYKITYLLIILLSCANLLLTLSRNSWLSFAIGLVVLIFTFNWRFIYLMITGGAIMLLIPNIKARITQFSDMSQNQGRIKIWSIALKMINEHPIRGIGNGNFSELYDNYAQRYPQYWQENVSKFPSHNSYLKLQSELGICGTLAFLSIIFFVFKSLLNISKSHIKTINQFYHGFFISTVSFLVLNLFDNILFVPQVAIVFWVFVFLSICLKDREKKA